VKDFPYYRGVELAVRGLATGYGFAFPSAASYSMLEFGVAEGNSFRLLLHFRDYWLRRLRLRTRVVAFGFDTFEGLPPPRPGDEGTPWQPGDYNADLPNVRRAIESHGFRDFRLVPGLFADTIPTVTEPLRVSPPVFVAVDCDYYSSTMEVLKLLADVAPNGCVVYFDDVAVNCWSDRTGELRAIREFNEGAFGADAHLSELPLYVETGEMRHYKQMWRLVRASTDRAPLRAAESAPIVGRLSPL